MSEARVFVNFPWLFNSLSGVQSASELDNNFGAVNLGTVSIGTQILVASTTLVASNDYSFFLCLPTNDMNITMPSSMAPNWSFFVSNQSANNVTLIGPWTIDGQQIMNPVLPGAFGSLTGVKGGLAVFDGATLSLYPQVYVSGGGGPSGLTRGVDSIAHNATSHQINHNLGDINAILVGAWPNWNTTTFFDSQDANSITVTFNNSCPLISGGQLQWSVTT